VQAEKDEDELPIHPDQPTPEREVEGLFENSGDAICDFTAVHS